MTNTQRQQLIAKIHKVLKQHYKPVVPNVSRPVLEQVLFACCLEDAPYDLAERVFARLGEGFFDLNEVRVTTVAELAETLAELPDPSRAGLALRRVLQSVFESSYSFTLDHAKKHSLAYGLKTLEHLHGIPPFVVAFVASTGLGGHFIPLDRGALAVLWLTGAISREEYDAGKAPWIERMVPKKSGVEFSSLLHQFGADVLKNVHATNVRKMLLSIDATAKDRLPKRGEDLPPRNPPPPPVGRDGKRAAEAARTAAEEHRPAGPQAAARPAGKTPVPPTGPAARAASKSGKPGPKPFVVKPNVGKPITIKPELARPEAAKPPASNVKSPASNAKSPASKPKAAKPRPTKPPAKPKPASPKAGGNASAAHKAAAGKSKGKSHSLELAKKKPR